MKHQDTLQESQPQDGLVPYEAVELWRRRYREGYGFPDNRNPATSADGCIPCTVLASSFQPTYWPLNTAGGRDCSLISSALRAEAVWIALNERPLWQRLREKPL